MARPGMNAPRHFISTAQASPEFLETIFAAADQFKQECVSGKYSEPLKHKILASVFYEPSTRTRFSFESAMLRLGGHNLTSESAGQFSSAVKGETIEDSTAVICGYADTLVMRHPEKGSVAKAAAVATIPVINAGDGAGEHPTQALLDLYTIKEELGRLDNFHIAFVGDLLNSRPIHSQLPLLARLPHVRFSFVSPTELQLPNSYLEPLDKARVTSTTDLASVMPDADIVYMTRVQKERFSTPEAYEKVKDSYILTPEIIKMLPKDSRIMHPLPRVNEISPEIDHDPRAAYFRQAQNGLYVRMALLAYVMNVL
jgi:aspartate carbamoyltransferase catalytic subunit